MSERAPPPYHDWMSVPDTSQLPPPPSIHYENSWAANASRDDAERAHQWTDANVLWPARQLELNEAQALSIGFASVLRPPEFRGTIDPIRERPGSWKITTEAKCGDCLLQSNVPLYSAILGAPKYGQKQISYFEIRVGEMAQDAGIGVGFFAPPYPTWRLPGWERASLGVHGDDGRKYVNDTWGGVDFTDPFRQGEVIGIGMEFESNPQSKKFKPGDASVHVFLTRDGQMSGSWNLHEAVDANRDQPGGVSGLEGANDLYAGIGVYGLCEFEIRFARHNWSYRLS